MFELNFAARFRVDGATQHPQPADISLQQSRLSRTSRAVTGGAEPAVSHAYTCFQLIALVTTAYLVRRDRRVLVPTVLAILFVLGAQVLFWTYTHPANVATANWTVPTDDWARLRRIWEYSHLARAGLQALAMTSLIIAVVSRLPTRRRGYHYY